MSAKQDETNDNLVSIDEIIDTFFNKIELLEGVDKNIAKIIKELYKDGNLTSKDDVIKALKTNKQ